jgi:formylglycine-generating enzyme
MKGALAKRSLRAVLLVSLGLASGGACSLAFPLDRYASLPPDSGTTGGDARTDDAMIGTEGGALPEGALPLDGAGGDGGTGCPSNPNAPTMVNVGPFCIDSTEVTQTQYNAFLISGRSPGDLSLYPSPNVCAWNTAFTPNAMNNECSPPYPGFDAVKYANYPISCINWCDAYAFCIWAGRHLCGRTDAGTGGNANEWTYACSNDGNLTYPYGNSYGPMVCNGADNGLDASVQVASLAGCKETFDGASVYDLSGNVREWTDDCKNLGGDGQDDGCVTGGGDYWSPSSALQCAMPGNDPRYYAEPDRGFRCCASP